MLKASPETFQVMYFSRLAVQCEVHLKSGWVAEWWSDRTGEHIFLASPETHHKYLKFVEAFEKDKPLLTELR